MEEIGIRQQIGKLEDRQDELHTLYAQKIQEAQVILSELQEVMEKLTALRQEEYIDTLRP